MEIANNNVTNITYKEYVTWGENERCEVLDGKNY